MMQNKKPDFMIEPEQLTGLEGRRFIVLRPNGEVSKLYKEVQAKLKNALSNKPVTYPNTEHVMLRGFPVGTSTSKVTQLGKELAEKYSNFEISIESLMLFPPPFKIVVFEIKKTHELISAYEFLAKKSNSTGLPYFEPERTSDEWTFHASVAYCEDLSEEEWSDVQRLTREIKVPQISCEVTDIEIVAYDNSREGTTVIKLGQE